MNLNQFSDAEILRRAAEIRGRQQEGDARNTDLLVGYDRSLRQRSHNPHHHMPYQNIGRGSVNAMNHGTQIPPIQEFGSNFPGQNGAENSMEGTILDDVALFAPFPNSHYFPHMPQADSNPPGSNFNHSGGQQEGGMISHYDSALDDPLGFADLLDDSNAYPTPAQTASSIDQCSGQFIWDDSRRPGTQNGGAMPDTTADTDDNFDRTLATDHEQEAVDRGDIRNTLSQDVSALSLPKERQSLSSQSSLSSSWENVSIVLAQPEAPEEVSETNRGPSKNRRQPFRSIEKREGTRETRKLKACLRCRMQRIRCEIDDNDPGGICRTCQAVSNESKQIVHRLPCLRIILTETTLFRTGGLNLTKRWDTPQMKDLDGWADEERKRIQITLGICPEPIELTVRKFIPKEGDILMRNWVDGNTKKTKILAAYAIDDIAAAAVGFRQYIDANAFLCMEQILANSETLVRETYAMAKRHLQTAADEEEKVLMQNVIRLWFAIRHTTGSSWICGDETLGMEPELKDRSYPLFGKVSIPRIIIAQIDMFNTLRILQPLRKFVLDHLQRLVLSNKPKSWFTIYLSIFILLHDCSIISADRYRHARDNSMKSRYSIPLFVENLHHGANVLLAHFHYYNKPLDPFSFDWKNRQSTPLADLSTGQIRFIIRTSELVKQKEEDIRIVKEYGLFEDDLYFVSQMFEQNWTPRDTFIA